MTGIDYPARPVAPSAPGPEDDRSGVPRWLPTGRIALLLDVCLVAWMTGFALYMARHWEDQTDLWRDFDALSAMLLVMVHLPLVARRYAPLPVFVAVCVPAAVYLALGYYQAIPTFALPLALFTVTANHRPRVSLQCAFVIMALLLYGARLADPELGVVSTLIAIVIAIVAWAFGESTRQLAERGRRLAVLTERLRHEQQERVQQAAAEERTRIARELHDVVAHHMSVIAVQAGTGRFVFDADPQTARRTLAVIEHSAHEALTDLRRLLAVLHHSNDEPAPHDPAPGLGRLPELLQRVRAAGARVEYVVHGSARPVSPGAELVVYRVIQESLTNVLKHADPPEATVTLDWRPDTVVVRVSDAGRPVDRLGSGHGVAGMRERAALYGGTLTAAARPHGGFDVTLTLPIRPPD